VAEIRPDRENVMFRFHVENIDKPVLTANLLAPNEPKKHDIVHNRVLYLEIIIHSIP